MKIRMIEGFYEQPGDETDYYLAPVAFPMQVEYLDDDPNYPGKMDLHDEDALRGWAERRFLSYEVWDMEVPQGALVEEITNREGASAAAEEPVAVLAIEGGALQHVETRGGAVVEVSDYDKHSDEPLILRRYRGTECIARRVEDH